MTARIAVGVAAFACIVSVGLAPAAVAQPSQSTGQATPAHSTLSRVRPLPDDGYWQYNYYDNYFYWLYTCQARGREMIRTVPGVIDFRCHLDAPPKYSMDVKWRWA